MGKVLLRAQRASRVFNWFVVFVFLSVVAVSCASGRTTHRGSVSHTSAHRSECRVYIAGNSPALYDDFLEVFQSLGCSPVASERSATLLATARREEWRSDCGSNLRARLLIHSQGKLVMDKSSTARCISYGTHHRVDTAVILLDLLVRNDFIAYQRAIRPLL